MEFVELGTHTHTHTHTHTKPNPFVIGNSKVICLPDDF